jgi:predicted regulator of Ras-like GTPase activity (Roadblock/LC7/MglB family)
VTVVTQENSIPAPAQEVGFLIERLAVETEGIVHAIVLSTDGLKLAVSSGLDADQADRFAAAACSVFSVSKAIGRELVFGGYQQTVVRYANGHAIVVALGNAAALASITEAEAKLGNIAFQMSLFATKIGDLLSPEVRTVLRGGLAG